MSWTIPVPNENTRKKRRLDEVLNRAYKKKVIMFCSSSDSISNEEHYPSAHNPPKFFRIGAARDDGTAHGHSGLNNDFIFPGVNVRIGQGGAEVTRRGKTDGSSQEATSSSIATALAAGLAAMIISCARLSQPTAGGGQTEFKGITEHDTMQKAFNRISDSKERQFLPVWSKFNPASDVLCDDRHTDQVKVERIRKLCIDLIGSGAS
jgi:hypothetical protein